MAGRAFRNDQKHVVIVRGGSGTGKSVIAINLMASLLKKGYNAHYATGSKAFTETLRKIIGRRGSPQFSYFNSFMGAIPNAVDVIIADEAHRIREHSHNRYTPRNQRTDMLQIDELIAACKLLVCFIDDDQVVRPGEIGSSTLIAERATQLGCIVHEYDLSVQFRCAGSDGFINWVNNTLRVK